MVMVCMWLAVSLVAGIPVRSIVLTLVAALSILGLGLLAPSTGLVKPYQLKRVYALLGVDRDAKGDNYQTDRAEIAFGVGGVYGTGFLRGEQKADGYIPEQWNDFAFTIVGEEGGLIGATDDAGRVKPRCCPRRGIGNRHEAGRAGQSSGRGKRDSAPR